MWNIYIEITNIPLKIFVTIMMGNSIHWSTELINILYIYIYASRPHKHLKITPKLNNMQNMEVI